MPERTILIVDDHREVRRLIRLALEGRRRGLRILDLPSGEEALLVSSRQVVDLLLADVRLAGMSGTELAEKLRARSPKTRIILISGIPRDELEAQIARLKPDAFFAKPLDVTLLAEAVEKLLEVSPEVETTAPLSTSPAAVSPVPAPEPPLRKPEQRQPESQTAAPVLSLEETLTDLQSELGASGVVLLDESGGVAAQAGEAPQAGMQTWLAEVYRPGGNAAGLLNGSHNQGVLSVLGPGANLHLAFAGGRALICLAPAGGNETQRGKLLERLADALRVFNNGRAKPAEQPNPAPAAEEPQVDPGELDTLFQKHTASRLGTGELNLFWDQAAEKSEDQGPNAAVISYDQALKLGINPGEESD